MTNAVNTAQEQSFEDGYQLILLLKILSGLHQSITELQKSRMVQETVQKQLPPPQMENKFY